MPKRPVRESAHVTFTDHRILRRPKMDRQTHSEGFKLRAILPTELDDPVVATRNLGFAYAALASSTGRKEFHRKVVDILRPLEGTKVADAAFWQTLAEAHLSLDENARAEDALALAEEIRERVKREHGIELEYEVELWRAETSKDYADESPVENVDGSEERSGEL